MTKTIRILTLLALMVIGAGQAWAKTEPDLGKIVYTKTVNDHGTLSFYADEACQTAISNPGNGLNSSGLTSVKDGSGETVIGYKVYIQATPDLEYTLEAADNEGKVSFITAEVTVAGTDVAGARTRGTAPTVGVGDFIDVTATTTTGVYCMTMPADKNLNLHITATFPERPYLTGVNYIDPTKTGNAQNATTPAGTKVYILTGTETNLPGGWYVVSSDVALTTKLNFTGDAYLILADGKTLSIDASNDDYTHNVYYGLSCMEGEIGNSPTFHDLTIYGQTAGTGKVTVNHGHPGLAYSCAYNANNITINGGVVETKNTVNGVCGSNITINGGQVLAPNNANIRADVITLGWSKPSDCIQAGGFVNPSGQGTITIAAGKVFTDGTNIYDNTTTTATLEHLSYVTLRPCLVLADDASNAEAIASYSGKTIAVALNGRTLTKDGNWNTLCMPFDVTIASSPLAGVSGDNPEAKVFANTSNLNDGVLTLNFSDAPATIPAGTPFIIKWVDSEQTIENPVFVGVTISTTAAQEVESTDEKVKFVGQYSPFSITNDNINEIIYLGANNVIGYASETTTLQSCSTHFVVPTTSSSGRTVTSIVMNLEIESESGTIVTWNENGYTVTVDERNGSGGVITLPEGATSITAASLTYDRTLTAPGSGSGDVTIDNSPAKLYTTCLPEGWEKETGVKYYTLSSVSGSTLHFSEIDGDPQADTPYLVAVTGNSNVTEHVTGNNVTLKKTVTGSSANGYTMMGTQTGLTNSEALTAAGSADNATYILQTGSKWGKVKSDNDEHRKAYIPPFRAFIVELDVTSSGARQMNSSFGDDDATSIDSIKTTDADGTERWYDLNGRRIAKPNRKGLYIRNGKVTTTTD